MIIITKRIVKIVLLLLAICGIVVLITKSGVISKFIGDKTNYKDIKTVNFSSTKKIIDFDLGVTDLNIKVSDKFKITSNNDKLNYEEQEDRIVISENNSILKNGINNKILNIYIPKKDYFNDISIKASVGSIFIEDIKVNSFSSKVTAGSTTINNIEVLTSSKIIGGTGKIDIKKGSINNLDIKSAVGSTNMNVALSGDNNVKTGVGGFNLNLQGDKTKYYFDIDAKAGNFMFDGERITGSTTYGNGSNRINITSGVGDLNITFKK